MKESNEAEFDDGNFWYIDASSTLEEGENGPRQGERTLYHESGGYRRQRNKDTASGPRGNEHYPHLTYEEGNAPVPEKRLIRHYAETP